MIDNVVVMCGGGGAEEGALKGGQVRHNTRRPVLLLQAVVADRGVRENASAFLSAASLRRFSANNEGEQWRFGGS